MPQSADQFSGIFICYRREDSGGHAGRLYDRLVAHFGDEQIFMDLDRIEPGEDFVQVIERAVGSCEILLAVIGRSWLKSLDETGRRRLDNPNDFISVEIAAAFARDVRVIPVLVQGAQMPRAQDLPEDLRPLSRRQAFDLSDQRWRQDVDNLVGKLEGIFARQREARLRAAVQEEIERLRREAEAQAEAEAQRQAEESERLKLVAAEAVRRKLEAVEAERGRREAQERERRAAEQVASKVPLITEPANETPDAQGTSAVETLPASASSFHKREAAPPVKTPPPASRSGRVALIIFIISLTALIALAATWRFKESGADETQVTANRNATPAETPPTGQKETPSPTAETPQAPAGMVYVPGGDFTMGRDKAVGVDEYEWPAHEVTVEPFFIDIYEVTRNNYKKCVDEKRCTQPQGWTDGIYPQGTAQQPVTGVDWDDANAYAKWRSERDGVRYRLPTEQEWEYAAHGEDGRRYPWGNNWQRGRANADGASGVVVDVNSYPEGKSPFGVFNMVGNAWEWTASELTAYPGGQIPPPQSPGDLRVIRGGSFDTKRNQATTTYRRGYPARGADDYTKMGFRCISAAQNSPTSP